MKTFDETYKEIISNIIENGYEEFNQRTGHKTKALPGLSFSIDLEKDGFPLLTLRRIPIKMFVAEQMFYISGKNDTNLFLNKHTKIWNEFSKDGILEAAYGFRWRNYFKRDQLQCLIDQLKNDPSSRQAVVITWSPDDDGYSGTKKMNLPCLFSFTCNIINGRLNMQNFVRSQDMILGFPSDVAGFCLLQYILAQEIGVKVGQYSHFCSHGHVYDTHYEGANELLKRTNNHEPVRFWAPRDSFTRAEKCDETLLNEIVNILDKQYKPLEKIEGLKIIL